VDTKHAQRTEKAAFLRKQRFQCAENVHETDNVEVVLLEVFEFLVSAHGNNVRGENIVVGYQRRPQFVRL